MKNRNFFFLWQGMAVSYLGASIFSIVAVLWLVEVANSASLVGLFLGVGGLFSTLWTPLGGVLADRYSRRWIIILVDCCNGLATLGMAALFYFSDNTPLLIACLFLIQALKGVGFGLFVPTLYAILPDMLAKEQLAMGNAVVLAVVNGAFTFGRALGGLLFVLFGTPLLMLCTGVSFLLSAFSEGFIQLPETKSNADIDNKNHPRGMEGRLLDDISEGGRYILIDRGLVDVCLLSAGLSWCLGVLFVSSPFLVQYHFHQSSNWYGYLLAGLSVGFALGAAYAKHCFHQLTGLGSRLQALVLSAILMPITFIGIAVTKTVMLVLLLFIVFGAVFGLANTIMVTQVQATAPDHLRGRVLSLFSMVQAAVVPVSGLVAGFWIDYYDKEVGLVQYWSGGLACSFVYPLLVRRTLKKFICKIPGSVENVDPANSSL